MPVGPDCGLRRLQKSIQLGREALPLMLRAYNDTAGGFRHHCNVRWHKSCCIDARLSFGPLRCPSKSKVQHGNKLVPLLFVLVLDRMLQTALISDGESFHLQRRVGRHQTKKQLSVLDYADDLALLSLTVEDAQRQLDRLVVASACVGLVVNTQKTIFFRGAYGHAMSCCAFSSLCASAGLIPDAFDDLRRRRVHWAVFNSVRTLMHSLALPDSQLSALLQAVIETVLLYNAEAWDVDEDP